MGYDKLQNSGDHQQNVELGEDCRAQRNKKELCITLKVFYFVLIGLLLLSMIIICTIYISHLQDHVQRLDVQVAHLQKVYVRVCAVCIIDFMHTQFKLRLLVYHSIEVLQACTWPHITCLAAMTTGNAFVYRTFGWLRPLSWPMCTVLVVATIVHAFLKQHTSYFFALPCTLVAMSDLTQVRRSISMMFAMLVLLVKCSWCLATYIATSFDYVVLFYSLKLPSAYITTHDGRLVVSCLPIRAH